MNEATADQTQHPVSRLDEAHYGADIVGEQVKALGQDRTQVAHGLIIALAAADRALKRIRRAM